MVGVAQMMIFWVFTPYSITGFPLFWGNVLPIFRLTKLEFGCVSKQQKLRKS